MKTRNVPYSKTIRTVLMNGIPVVIKQTSEFNLVRFPGASLEYYTDKELEILEVACN